MIEVTLLGTGSPIPDPNRAGPSTLVRAGGQVFLVDCGRGVLQRAAAVGVGAGGLSALLLTHLHSDHIGDLGDVLITRGSARPSRRCCGSLYALSRLR
jgi:ribonuclease Z